MKLKVGIIGCGGYWAKNYLRIINEHPDCKLNVICDSNIELLQKIKSEHRYPIATENIETIFEYKEKELDCAIVCTPVKSHYRLVGELLNNGVHVLCEKAFTYKSVEAEDLIAASHYKGLSLSVGHTYIHNNYVQHIKKLLDEKVLGDIYYVSMTRFGMSPVRQDVSAMWDLSAHDVSMLLYWFGEIPQSVSVFGKSYLQDGIEDVTFMDLEFSNNVIANIRASWRNPIKRRNITIVGSKKMISFDDVAKTLEIYEGDNKEVIDIPYGEPLKNVVDDFIDSIINNRQPLVTGEDGLNVVRVLEAGQKSLNNNSEKVYL
jgi:predicted dehydrogenase